jgi:hypothetical protein
MKNKFLIFGGAALLIGAGVGAYLWYKKSLKNVSEESKPSVEPIVDSIVDSKQAYADTIKRRVEDKLALAVSTNQLAMAEPHNYNQGAESWQPSAFNSNNPYGA